jgi:L-aminopeptidase/D-esterase-like protein
MKFLLHLLLCTSALAVAKDDIGTTLFKFDFDEFKIATAEYKQGPTGMTLLFFPKGARAAIDIRGGAAAVRESSTLSEENNWGHVDGIVLAGGSSYGLESISGVMAAMLKERGQKTGFDDIPSVPGAIVYDFGGRKTSSYPDKELGIQAYKNLRPNQVMVGRAGAGSNVKVGKYMGLEKAETAGQGAAYREVYQGIKVFVITVNNAVGAIHGRDGSVVRGNRDPKTGNREPVFNSFGVNKSAQFKDKQNTTITAVVTNADITRSDMKRLAVMAHTSMASTIRPLHTPWDGDTLFVVSTQSVKLPQDFTVSDLGVVTSELLTQALLRSVGAESY